MDSNIQLLLRRKSKSCTPLAGEMSQTPTGTPRTPGLVRSNGQLLGHSNGRITPSTPSVDASYRNDDQVSPMLAKLRMTPGNNCYTVFVR